MTQLLGLNSAMCWHILNSHAQQVGQRKFVLLFLFMATQGGGVVSGKLIMAAARRLRVT